MEDEQIKEKKDDQVDDMSVNDGEQEGGFDKEDLQCRFYRAEWPSNEELVVVSALYVSR